MAAGGDLAYQTEFSEKNRLQATPATGYVHKMTNSHQLVLTYCRVSKFAGYFIIIMQLISTE